jgi:hypothetical protein
MDFKIELKKLIEKIETKKPICFVRYGDGETMIMNNQSISLRSQAYSIDKWHSVGGETKIGNKLKEVLKVNEIEWLFGIPCECCNLPCKNYLISELDVDITQITYANMFVNSNYPYFLDWIKNITEEVVIIANKNGLNNIDKFPFKVKEYFPIEDDCVNYYENNSEIFTYNLKNKFKKMNNTLFFISAGPLSEVIIQELWSINKTNRLIDVGSSLDLFIHNKITRPYMEPYSDYYTKKCTF